MKITEQQLELIRKFFADKPVKRAYLFGSYARGDASEKSDIDIIVDLDYENGGADYSNFMNMKRSISELLKNKVDLLSSNGISKFIKPYIEKDKRLVYERIS